MNKSFIASVLAVVSAVAAATSLFVSSNLVAFLGYLGCGYLAVYGLIKLGMGVSNCISMLAYEKTVGEISLETGNACNKNTKSLGFGYGSISLLVLLGCLAINSVPYTLGAAIFLMLVQLFMTVIGYKAKRFRDGDRDVNNIS